MTLSSVQESTYLKRRLKGSFEHALEPHQTSLRVLKDLQEMVKKMSCTKEKQEGFYDTGHWNLNYSRNDRVWMKVHPLSKAFQQFAAKFAEKWISPYQTVENLGLVNCRVVLEDNEGCLSLRCRVRL